MKLTIILTILLSMLFLTIAGFKTSLSGGSLLVESDSKSMISITSVSKTSGIWGTFSRLVSIHISMPSISQKTSPAERTRFDLIHQKRAETNAENANNADTLQNLQGAKPEIVKSGIGNAVKSVEKHWVKIVEIVVPIAVGLPILILIGICCFVGCTGRKLRRQNKV